MNKLKEFGIEENTYKECLKQALRAGEPTYKFLLGEKVCMGCTAHKTICAILDNGLCYLVDDGDKFMCKPWHVSDADMDRLSEDMLNRIESVLSLSEVEHLSSSSWNAGHAEDTWDALLTDDEKNLIKEASLEGVTQG